MSGRRAWAPALVFAVAVGSALYWGAGVRQGSDANDYRLLAANVVDGHGFSLAEGPPYEPSARRAPGYPLVLAGLYATLGRSDRAVLRGQAVLWGVGALLLARLAGAIAGPGAGLLAGLVVASHPMLARMAGEVLTECSYTVCLLALAVAFDRALRTSARPWVALTGVLLGAAVLTRPLTGALLPLLWVGVWRWRASVGAAVRHAALLTVAAVLVVVPWVARNALAFGGFVPIQVQASGLNFWLATLPYDEQPVTSWAETWPRVVAKYPELRPVGEVPADAPLEARMAQLLARQRRLVRVGVARILGDPVAYLASRLRAYPHLWVASGGIPSLSGRTLGEAWRRHEWGQVVGKVGFLTAYSLAPLGLALFLLGAAGLPREHHVLWMVPAFVALAHLPLWIEYRFSLPAQPFLWGLAAVALARRRPARPAGVPGPRP